MTGNTGSRPPAAFDLDAPGLEVEVQPPSQEPLPQPPATLAKTGGARWGRLFWSATGSLLLLALLLWVQTTVLSLVARNDWIGWTASVLFAAAGFAFVMILAREIVALLQLSAITALRQRADGALAGEDVREAKIVAGLVRAALKDRPALGLGHRRLGAHDRDILNAAQVLAITERELILPLDRAARSAIGVSARRVSAVTSLSPFAFVTVGFVAYENFRLLRTLAGIYGGRPGFLAILRLLRLIAGHLAVTGGLALTDDLLHQAVGHGLTARLSRRLGEGLVNGGFTIRIGIAAVDVLRPMPYIEAPRPRFREFLAEFLKFRTGSGKPRMSGNE